MLRQGCLKHSLSTLKDFNIPLNVSCLARMAPECDFSNSSTTNWHLSSLYPLSERTTYIERRWSFQPFLKITPSGWIQQGHGPLIHLISRDCVLTPTSYFCPEPRNLWLNHIGFNGKVSLILKTVPSSLTIHLLPNKLEYHFCRIICSYKVR